MKGIFTTVMLAGLLALASVPSEAAPANRPHDIAKTAPPHFDAGSFFTDRMLEGG